MIEEELFSKAIAGELRLAADGDVRPGRAVILEVYSVRAVMVALSFLKLKNRMDVYIIYDLYY